MPYYLYKLNFTTPVHFGASKPGIHLEKISMGCCADTLFSALCLEFLQIYGEEGIDEFYNAAAEGRFLMSDLFPYYMENGEQGREIELCLPKPVLPGKRDINGKGTGESEQDSSRKKKKAKNLNYIPLKYWDDYLKYLKGEGKCDDLLEWKTDFVEEIVNTRVKINRVSETDESGNPKPGEPYYVSAVVYEEDAGLYFIVKSEDEYITELFDDVMNSLQYSGIGGKRSSGYGKFSFETSNDKIELDPECFVSNSDKKLSNLLLDKGESDYYMALSLIRPAEGELTENLYNNSFYKLINRDGFVNTAGSEPFKRRSVVMFSAGSCFSARLKGSIADVSDGRGHPVYRYGKALMMGVRI